MREIVGVEGLKPESMTVMGELKLAIPMTTARIQGSIDTVVAESNGYIALWEDTDGDGLAEDAGLYLMYGNVLDPERDFEVLQRSDGWATKSRRACIARHDYYISDCQRNHLYYWELNVFPDPELINVSEAREIVDYTIKLSGLKNIALDIVDKDSKGMSSLGKAVLRRVSKFGPLYDCKITIAHSDYSQDMVYAYVVLHELAHIIDYCRFRGNGHGPTFCAIYASMLDSSGLLPNAREQMVEAWLMVA